MVSYASKAPESKRRRQREEGEETTAHHVCSASALEGEHFSFMDPN
jgi:hypothetical protein